MASGYLSPYRRGSLGARGTSPFGTGSLLSLHQQMNRLFDDLFEQDGDGGQLGMTAPALELHQSDGKLEITAELPGVKEEDIDLSLEDGVLTLRGEKKASRTDEERGYSERSYGAFERRITLPPNVDEDACSAEFENGVLTITLPQSEEKSRGKRIPLGRRGSARADASNDQGVTIEHQQAASEEERDEREETQQQG
jgi:HSP20 family protein